MPVHLKGARVERSRLGITEPRIRFEVDSPASDEQLVTLLKLTERYCVVYQTMISPPRVQATLQRVAS